MENNKTKVYLIGGAPGAGKTTLGTALAARLGVGSLTIDDLVTAVIAVTTPETHPGLHVMRRVPYLDYYTNSTVDQLKADATLRHEAVWPMVKSVVTKHAKGKSSIVIDGWHLRPSWVAQLNLDNVWSGWLVTTNDVLETRERNNMAWVAGSTNPERMFHNFLARSVWYNALIKAEATKFNMDILYQPGSKSVNDLCQFVLDQQRDDA